MVLKEITTPQPLLRQKIKDANGEDIDVILGLLWYCQYYLDRAPAFRLEIAGAAGLRAASRIEDALLKGREPGQKVWLHDVDHKALRDVVNDPGQLGVPSTGLSINDEPLVFQQRALLRFIDAINDAVDVSEQPQAEAAE